jgi:hypothetical protein
MEPFDQTDARRPRKGSDVFPFLVALQNLLGGPGEPPVNPPVLFDSPHAILYLYQRWYVNRDPDCAITKGLTCRKD